MTTLTRTLHGIGLRARERWSVLVLLATWLVLAFGAASPAAYERGSPALGLVLALFAATLVRALVRELRPSSATYAPAHELELGVEPLAHGHLVGHVGEDGPRPLGAAHHHLGMPRRVLGHVAPC